MQQRPHARPRERRSLLNRSGFTLIELFVCVAIVLLLLALLLPNIRIAGPAARRTQCRNNLKQIGLALYNYAETHGSYPPAYTLNEQGEGQHSWRTLILPHLDERSHFYKINLSQAWNAPINSELQQVHIPSYTCPETRSVSQTTYMALVTSESFLREIHSAKIREVKDGTQNTVMIAEIPHANTIHWMNPSDASDAAVLSLNANNKITHTDGFHVAFVDGSVRFLNKKISAKTFHALTTIAGSEDVGNF